MKYQATTAVHKIIKLKKRIKIIQGGSSAGKTIATLLIWIDKYQTRSGLLGSVVSESFPHLKKGAMRDFLNIMEAHGYYKEDCWNRTDSIYTFETGSKIEFFSADNADKVRGPRRDDLFINECNNIHYETYTQLAIRTNGDIYLDYNPVVEFWVHTEIIPHQDHDFIILTYKDNEGLPQAIIDELESRRHRKGWASVYLDGQLGEVEGKIYTGWIILDLVPQEARLWRRGLDFGYTNDPAVIVDIYKYNGGFIIDELLYRKGMGNKNLADVILNTETDCITVCDSSEPKSIDELKLYGINAVPCVKGAGSINAGISFVQEQKIFVTKRSVWTIGEYRKYLWIVDKNGKTTNDAEEGNDHAMDAIRYAIHSVSSPDTFEQAVSVSYHDI